MTTSDQDILIDLLERHYTGNVTPEDEQRLHDMICNDPQAAHFYVDYMQMLASLRWHFDDEAAMPEFEAEPETHLEPIAFQSRVQRESNTLPWWKQRSFQAFAATFVLSATVIFGMLAYLQMQMNRPRDPGMAWQGDREIAVLAETRHTVWKDGRNYRAGTNLTAGRLQLQSGLARITFNGGASVILEGPADFEIRTAHTGHLHEGRLSAHAPDGAEGFTISAEGMRIIDLGTAFGVDLDRLGQAEVHVFDGEVEAHLVDANGQPLNSMHLKKDQAASLDPTQARINAIDLDSERFVRAMPLQPYRIDLADIVAGGDGRGHGTMQGINPINGRLETGAGLGELQGDHAYHPVVLSPFMDGVFIPDGSTQANQVSSGHHTFTFPATSNAAWDLIRRGGTQDQDVRDATNLPPVLDEVDYREPDHSLIGLHANAGVTFDLQAIRAANPEAQLGRFTAVAGNIGQKGDAKGLADAWVLVDGQKRFSRLRIGVDGRGYRIDVPLHANDRFLTLVSTDAGNGVGLDWIIFGNPVLHAEPVAPSSSRLRENPNPSNTASTTGGF